jgi:hypothetical protein
VWWGEASYCERADKNMRRLNQQTKRSGTVRRLAKHIGGREGIIFTVMEAANGMSYWQGLLSCEPLPAAVIWLLFSTIQITHRGPGLSLNVRMLS